jgi:hypothetical protein
LTSFLFYSLLGCGNGCPGALAIGDRFQPGHPTLGECPAGDTFVEDGCQGPTHSYYRVAIVISTVPLGDVWFAVQAPSGANDIAPGGLGFTILSPGGALLAQYPVVGGVMSMTSGWTYPPGPSNLTVLGTSDSLYIDMGTENPSGLNLSLVALGVGSYSGTTAPEALP